jgi:hypothetical protein
MYIFETSKEAEVDQTCCVQKMDIYAYIEYIHDVTMAVSMAACGSLRTRGLSTTGIIGNQFFGLWLWFGVFFAGIHRRSVEF